MSQVGTVYAQALYELAKDKGLDEVIHSELTMLDDCFAEDPDYIRLLRTPNLSKEERCQILDQGLSRRTIFICCLIAAVPIPDCISKTTIY